MKVRSWGGRKLAALAAVAGLALAAAAFAAAKQPIRFTPAGQAAARAVVLQRADLGSASGWTGGAKKPDLSSDTHCANFHPKDSDLVLIGAAETDWQHAGLEFDSEAQVLQTPKMVQLDWQRTVLSPHLLPCLRETLAKAGGASAAVVSVARLAFPQVAPYTRAFRTVVEVTSGTQKVRVLIDVVLIGRGRTEVTLTTTAPLAAEAVVRPAELRLARLLASRLRN